MPSYSRMLERFDAKVHVTDGCWLWTAAVNSDGYGTFNRGRDGGRRTDLAHRVAYEIAFGSVPAGLEVCHRCDVPRCVRPDHLFVGTHGDNVRDCVGKGRLRGHRYGAGAAHRGAKLTAEQVDEIRRTYRPGRNSVQRGNGAALAERFGVTKGTISSIARREYWTKQE